MPNRIFVRKSCLKVQLQMSGGILMQGNTFINIDARVSDLLNNSSVTFLPSESEGGVISNRSFRDPSRPVPFLRRTITPSPRPELLPGRRPQHPLFWASKAKPLLQVAFAGRGGSRISRHTVQLPSVVDGVSLARSLDRPNQSYLGPYRSHQTRRRFPSHRLPQFYAQPELPPVRPFFRPSGVRARYVRTDS